MLRSQSHCRKPFLLLSSYYKVQMDEEHFLTPTVFGAIIQCAFQTSKLIMILFREFEKCRFNGTREPTHHTMTLLAVDLPCSPSHVFQLAVALATAKA